MPGDKLCEKTDLEQNNKNYLYLNENRMRNTPKKKKKRRASMRMCRRGKEMFGKWREWLTKGT